MIIRKTRKYYQDKARIDKAVNKRTAYKIQVYNNNIIDKYVESYNSDAPTVKPSNSRLWADLAILNKPEVYKNYNRIINSKYTSNEAFDKILVKNKANAELNRIVEAEVERITKNLQYVEQVMTRYEVPMKMYNDLKAKQASKSMANRQQILKDVAVKANDLLVSDGLNIPSNVFSYKNLEASAENLLRQSQMQSKHEEINAINDNYKAEGKDALYNGKEWIWTGEGVTTRHASNDHQQRKVNEPFIIVNDETLDIDELMYPSDPAGSPSNTFICYCDIEYLTDMDNYDYDQVHLNSDAFKTHTDPLEAHVAINEPSPLSKVMFADSLVNGLTGEPITFDAVKPEPVGEFIDTADAHYSKYKNAYMFEKETMGDKFDFKFDEVLDKWTVNGLPVDIKPNSFEGGYIKTENIIEHNKQFTPETESNIAKDNIDDLTVEELLKPETTTEPQPLDIDALEPGMLSGEYKLPKDFDTSKIETVGAEPNSAGEVVSVATEEAINEYNKKLSGEIVEPENAKPDKTTNDGYEVVTESKKEYIAEDELPELSSTTYDIDIDINPELKQHIKYNETTGKYEYKGLEIKGNFAGDGYGFIGKDNVKSHNAQLPDAPEQTLPNNNVKGEKIDINDLESFATDEYTVYSDAEGFKYDPDTKKATYKGLEIKNFDIDYGFGDITLDEILKHNEQFKSFDAEGKEVVIDNKYINSVESIEQIKEGGEIYLKDKSTGKQYVYDERATYERAQDIEQHKITFTEYEHESTKHWGRYGHQLINGLIYEVKYKSRTTGEITADYSYFKKYKDKLMPLYDEAQALSRDYHRNGGVRSEYYRKMNKIKGKADKIIKTVEDPYGKSGLDVEDMKGAMWEIFDMDSAFEKAPDLLQDTFLVRFGHVHPEWLEVGKRVRFDGFTSTTYESNSAGAFESKMEDNPNRWAILIMADEGSNGGRLNDQFNALTSEREWCLARNQDFDVVDFNKDTRTLLIKLV